MNHPQQNGPRFSVVVPACDEERYLPACLDAIHHAAEHVEGEVEVIVVDNGSRDGTAALAQARGARVVHEARKNLSAVRNTGAAAAKGKYLVFIDADSIMAANMLAAIHEVMESGRYIGGGAANVRTNRVSLGIRVHITLAALFALLARLSCVVFYTRRDTFDKMGGFNERRHTLEDVDFAWRLKRVGRKRSLRFKNLFTARVVTSARKFDEFGDWAAFRHPLLVLGALFNSPRAAHTFWYRPRR